MFANEEFLFALLALFAGKAFFLFFSRPFAYFAGRELRSSPDACKRQR